MNWTNGQKYPLCIYCEIKFYAVKFLIIEKYILLYLSICPVISKRPKFLSNCCPTLDVLLLQPCETLHNLTVTPWRALTGALRGCGGVRKARS